MLPNSWVPAKNDKKDVTHKSAPDKVHFMKCPIKEHFHKSASTKVHFINSAFHEVSDKRPLPQKRIWESAFYEKYISWSVGKHNTSIKAYRLTCISWSVRKGALLKSAVFFRKGKLDICTKNNNMMIFPLLYSITMTDQSTRFLL